MKLADAIKLAFKNLLRTKFRSILTISGVVIGISAIVLFVSLGSGLQKITSDQIASIDVLTTLTVNQKPETAAMEAGPPLTDKAIEMFKTIKGVDKVSPSVSLTGNISVAGTSTGAIIYGIEPENIAVEITGLKTGESITDPEKDVVISTALANALDENIDNLIGKEITITMVKNIDGLETKVSDLKLVIAGIDSNETANIVYAPFKKIYEAGQFEKYSGVKVKVKSRKDIDGAKKFIEDEGFSVTTIKDLIDQIDKIFLILQIILIFVGGIGLLVASLGIVNTMTISLLERTHEIGIMKAIGASNKDVRCLFFWESALIGLIGGVSGVGIAVFFGFCFNTLVNHLIKNSNQHLELFITPVKFSLIIILFSMFISIVSGLYPARRAQKLLPIDALRQ